MGSRQKTGRPYMSDELIRADALTVVGKLRKGEVTPHDLLDALEKRIAAVNGPVNALDAAVRKALIPVYPNIETVTLDDYKVRIIGSNQGTGARTRVLIDSTDHHDNWCTVGVSNNIIEASWLALVDSYEYKLRRG